MIEPFATGFATSLGLIVAIGSQNAFVLRQGILRSHVPALVLFCGLSDALLIAAGVAGAGALVQLHPQALLWARWGGAVFLIGYALLAARRALRPGTLTPFDAPALPLRAALTLCAGFTFLNPHVYLDAVVLVGVLANAWAAPANAWFGLGAALASLAWFAALGFGARLLRPVFAKPLAWRVLDGLIALTMGTLAMLLWFGPGPAVASL